MFSLLSSLGQGPSKKGFPYNPVRQEMDMDDYVWDDNESASDNDENFEDPETSQLVGGNSKGLPREVRFYNNSVNAYSHYSSSASKWYNKYLLFFLCGLGIYFGTTLIIRIGSFVGQNNSKNHGGGGASSIIESQTNNYLWDDEMDDDLMDSFDPFDTTDNLTSQSIESLIDDTDTIEIDVEENYKEDNDNSSMNIEKEDINKEENFKNLVEQIVILGERNSGVNWFMTKIKECFPDILITSKLSRPSHYFQSEDIFDSKTPTLVLTLFLNVYDWVDTMRRHPRYMPNHMGMSNWKEFVETPWTMKQRPQRDIDLWDQIHHDETKRVCQMNFTYHQIIPCLRATHIPDGILPKDYNAAYELKQDSSNQYYQTITEMRADKIENFLSIMDWDNIELLLPIQYETLVEIGGFDYILKHIEDQTGLQMQCDAMDSSFLAPVFWKGHLDEEYINWINNNVFWESEWLLGYDYITSHFDSQTKNKDVNRDYQHVDGSKEDNKGNWNFYRDPEISSEYSYILKNHDNSKDMTPSPSPSYESLITEFPSNIRITWIPPPDDLQPVGTTNLSHEDSIAYIINKSKHPPQSKKKKNTGQDKKDDAVTGDLSYLVTNPTKTNTPKEQSKKENNVQISSWDPMPLELQDDDFENPTDDDSGN